MQNSCRHTRPLVFALSMHASGVYQCVPVLHQCASVPDPLSSPYQCLSMHASAVCTRTLVPALSMHASGGLLATCRSQISGRDYQPSQCLLQSSPVHHRVSHGCMGGPLVRGEGGTPSEDTPSMPLVTLHVCRTLLLQNICQRRQVGCFAAKVCCAVLPMHGCFAILCYSLLCCAAGSKDRGGS